VYSHNVRPWSVSNPQQLARPRRSGRCGPTSCRAARRWLPATVVVERWSGRRGEMELVGSLERWSDRRGLGLRRSAVEGPTQLPEWWSRRRREIDQWSIVVEKWSGRRRWSGGEMELGLDLDESEEGGLLEASD
jgi:hypothetical protein